MDGGVVVARMLAGQGNYGFDAGRKEYVDLVEAGITTQPRSCAVALENAVLGRERSSADGGYDETEIPSPRRSVLSSLKCNVS